MSEVGWDLALDLEHTRQSAPEFALLRRDVPKALEGGRAIHGPSTGRAHAHQQAYGTSAGPLSMGRTIGSSRMGVPTFVRQRKH